MIKEDTPASGNSGPLFTADDLDKIENYVDYGSRLPVVIPAVVVFIGYEHAGVPGLEPGDMLGLFKKINHHASQWEGIQDSISRQTRTLGSISKKIVSMGNSLLKEIEAMPFYERVQATVGKNPLVLSPDKIPDEKFDSKDKAKKKNLEDHLDKLLKINFDRTIDTGKTMQAITVFRREISVLEPDVANKRQTIKNSNLERIGHETTVEPMIDALNREYQTAMSDGSNPSVVAAKREALENSLAALKDQIQVYRGRQRVTYTMGRLFVNLTELGVSMVNAEMSLGHLWTSWKKAESELGESSKTLSDINSGRSLIVFAGRFQSVINNWTSVRDQAVKLSRIF